MQMKPMWMCVASLLGILLCGCVEESEAPEDFVVVGARLENLTSEMFGIAFGYQGATADLVMQGQDGQGRRWRVEMDGIVFMHLGWASQVNALDSVDFDFSEVDGEVRSPDLLGKYTGLGGTLSTLYGFRGTRFANDIEASFAPFFWTEGFDVGGPLSTLTIAVVDGG
jgi:hypothetical protein